MLSGFVRSVVTYRWLISSMAGSRLMTDPASLYGLTILQLLDIIQSPQRFQDRSTNRPLPGLHICAPALGQPAKLIKSLLEIGQIPPNCIQVSPKARQGGQRLATFIGRHHGFT